MPNGSLDLNRLFSGLSDPARRSMLDRLSRGPAPVSELARPLPMALPTVMQHLRVLEDAGLVRSEKVGRVRVCSIQPGALNVAEQWINARRIGCERQLDALGEYLSNLPDEEGNIGD